jgi:hypothetical protein
MSSSIGACSARLEFFYKRLYTICNQLTKQQNITFKKNCLLYKSCFWCVSLLNDVSVGLSLLHELWP